MGVELGDTGQTDFRGRKGELNASWVCDSSRGKIQHTHTHAIQRVVALHFLSELLKR